MSATLMDIIKHLEVEAKNNSLSVDRIQPKVKRIVGVDYYLRIICVDYPYSSAEDLLASVEPIDDDDKVHPYGGYHDIDDAIDVCKQFYIHSGQKFTQKEEQSLRRTAGVGRNILLFVVERPIYQG